MIWTMQNRMRKLQNGRTTSEVARALAQQIPSPNYTGAWFHNHGLLVLNLFLLVPMSSQYNQGYDGGLQNNLQLVNAWQDYFGHPTGSLLGAFNALPAVASIAATFFMPFAADQYGRRFGIAAGSIICLIATALTAASNGIACYMVARFMIGLGSTIISIGPILVAELALAQHRATATALSNTGFSLGSIIAAWTTFGTFHIVGNWAWRLPAFLQCVGSIIQLVGVYFMPESPRWLISKGRNDEALHIFAKYHANGNENSELVQFEYNEAVETINLERQAKEFRWTQMFRGRGNQLRAFCLIWWYLLPDERQLAGLLSP